MLEEVRDNLRKQPDEIQRDLLLSRSSDFFGNFYVGKIVNNQDSEQRGRCQILVYGKYEGIPDDDLPWALPDFNLNGAFTVPDVGTVVNVYFRNNDFFMPHYSSRVIDENRITSLKGDDYPHTWVLWDDLRGDYFLINKKNNESTLNFASGVTISVDSKGNLNISTMNAFEGKIKVVGRTEVEVDAPIVKFPVGSVTPNPVGGPFNCINYDPLLGVPHQGDTLTRVG